MGITPRSRAGKSALLRLINCLMSSACTNRPRDVSWSPGAASSRAFAGQARTVDQPRDHARAGELRAPLCVNHRADQPNN